MILSRGIFVSTAQIKGQGEGETECTCRGLNPVATPKWNTSWNEGEILSHHCCQNATLYSSWDYQLDLFHTQMFCLPALEEMNS